jgi:hypothetical protein
MMSKRQFAKMILNTFCECNGVTPENAHCYIASSSKLSVALEYLGMLDDKELRYSKQRGGAEFTYFGSKEDSPAILTAREIMSFLPDEDVVFE